MLTERIMHECVKKLVDYTGIPDEAEIESLTKLLKTIGFNLDSTEKGKPMMDVYFQRIQSMIDTPELPSRLRFMLMDIIDLRKKRWASKDNNKGPKTLDEVRIEVRFFPVTVHFSKLLTHHRPKQLPVKRPLRTTPVAVSVEVDVCKWVGEMEETSPTNTTNHQLITRRTLLVWMIFVVSPTRMPAEPPASRCHSVQHQCSHRAATVAARWVPAVH